MTRQRYPQLIFMQEEVDSSKALRKQIVMQLVENDSVGCSALHVLSMSISCLGRLPFNIVILASITFNESFMVFSVCE